MDNPQISLICPVYKAETYLDRCITSVLDQTFVDWELLLIDDGSPDSSGSICDSYAEKDSRITVIHKNNEGVSAARQDGLNHASGTYVIHIDPDDWIEKDMLEVLYHSAKLGDYDMVICDFYEDTRTASVAKKQKPSDLNSETVFTELFSKLHGSCCNKLVKRKLFEKYSITFPEGYVYLEDLYVNLKLCCNHIKIAYVPQSFYHYIQDNNPNSLVHKPTRKKVESQIKFCLEFEQDLVSRGLNEDLYSLKYEAKVFAMQSGCYSPGEIRNIFSEINKNLIRDAVSNMISKPWKMELALSLYLPRYVSKRICSVFHFIKRMNA